ncbi:hypothetical protein BH09ACT1_BH09ACT1_11240 [soil metagenome]
MDYDTDYSPLGAIFGLIFGLVYFLILVGGYVVVSWFLMRVFRKAGIEGWKAWVPFYNYWVFLELGGQPGWLVILSVVPIASIIPAIFMCIAAFHIGAAFDKRDAGWVVLFIFLAPVWLGIIAFDSSRWDPARMSVRPIYGPNVPWPKAGPTPPPPPGY